MKNDTREYEVRKVERDNKKIADNTQERNKKNVAKK